MSRAVSAGSAVKLPDGRKGIVLSIRPSDGAAEVEVYGSATGDPFDTYVMVDPAVLDVIA